MEERCKEIGPLPQQRLLCLLGSALCLGSAFGGFLCGVAFFVVFVVGLCGVLEVFGCCFWVVGLGWPAGDKCDPNEDFLTSAKGSEPLGSGSTCPGNGKFPAVGPA